MELQKKTTGRRLLAESALGYGLSEWRLRISLSIESTPGSIGQQEIGPERHRKSPQPTVGSADRRLPVVFLLQFETSPAGTFYFAVPSIAAGPALVTRNSPLSAATGKRARYLPRHRC